jgi:protein-tyrosine phosphatase
MKALRFPALAVVAALGILAQPLVPHAIAQAPAATTTAHQRLLPLQGGRNFRDLGGYRTADGRHVKWGVLFRSGTMNGLTPADFDYLGKLGIRTVCDFRDTHERAAEPVTWPRAIAPTVFADDYDMGTNSMMAGMDMAHVTPAQAREQMAATYAQMPVTFNGQYRRMFQQLLAGHAPLAFNCSAGKDRTGVAAALILTALGVPRETVVQDYLLTNRYLNAGTLATSKATGDWAKLPPAVLQAFMAADPSYIATALHVIDSHAGGIDGYFRDELGLSHADIVRLRHLYLV